MRTLTGLVTGGDGGLLDLALSPTYDEDGLIYAYVTTPADNRVIDFTLTGPATPVLDRHTARRHRQHRPAHVRPARRSSTSAPGTPGHPSLAADPNSLAGKVLRVNAIGQSRTGEPGWLRRRSSRAAIAR